VFAEFRLEENEEGNFVVVDVATGERRIVKAGYHYRDESPRTLVSAA
jgi:hypothetical protein